MSLWIKAHQLPTSTPVNLNNVYSIYFQERTPEQVRAYLDQTIKMNRGAAKFSVYFFPGCSMQEEECEVSWSFSTYMDAYECYQNVQSLLGVIPV